MKHLFFILLATVLSSSAFATSPYFGPFVVKRVGTNSCLIKPTGVTTIINGIRASRPISLSWAKLKNDVVASQRTPLKTVRVYVRAVVPPIEILVGQAPKFLEAPIYKDGGSLQKRNNAAAERLIRLVNAQCPQLL